MIVILATCGFIMELLGTMLVKLEDQLDHKDHKVFKVQLDLKEHKDSKEFRVQWVHREHKEFRVL